MDNLEKVEKIREKTGVSYEDAKSALELCDYDVLDAIVYLEKQGKVSAPTMSSYTTSNEATKSSERFVSTQVAYNDDCKKSSIGDAVDRFFSWCGRMLKKSWESKFVVYKNNNKLGAMPVLVLILLMLCAFWVTVPLMIIGLFFDFKYSFQGVGKVTVDLNDMCDKASDACTNIKNDIKSDKDNE
ncbi:MAG: UBA/TS-N domain protein [Wujia sp.]